jgi:hypothetical protein
MTKRFTEKHVLQFGPGRCAECGDFVTVALFVGADGYRAFCALELIELNPKNWPKFPFNPIYLHRHENLRRTEIHHATAKKNAETTSQI